MADAESRKERFQGQIFERNEDTILNQRYLKMKQERDADKSRENANRVNLEDAVDIVGTCDMMCPEFESLQRYFERDIDPFEKSPSGAYDRRLMVQTFARAAAGNDLPPLEDIRPPPILRMTVDYLLDDILVKNGIEATHNFIWGRTRAVRSDLTRQRDHSADTIYCLERIVRYHILAFHAVCRGRREIETLEIEQLKKALQSLMEVYHDARSNYTSPDEAEFRAYYILMHIRSRHAPFTLRNLPSAVYSASILQWALRIRFTLSRNSDGADEHNSDVTQMDYAGFFDLVSQPPTSYLMACLLETHFDDIRRQMCLMLGLTLKNTARVVTLPQFQALLQLDNAEEAEGWLSHLKWNMSHTGLVDIPQSRRADVLLPPVATATPYPRTKSALVESKKDVPGLPAHITVGMLDSLITRRGGSKFGRAYTDPPGIPRQRRRAPVPTNFLASQTFTSAAPVNPLPHRIPPNPFTAQPFAQSQTQPQPAQVPFNPFGPRKPVAPSVAAVGVFAPVNKPSQPLTAPAAQPSQPSSSQPTSTQFPFQPPPQTPIPVSSAPSANPVQNSYPPTFAIVPPSTFSQPSFPSRALSTFNPSNASQTALKPSTTPSPTFAPPTAPNPSDAGIKPTLLAPIVASAPAFTQNMQPQVTPQARFVPKPPTPLKEVAPPSAPSFGHSFSFTDYETDSGIMTTPPVRPSQIQRKLSDGYITASTEVSIMPASTHASPPRRLEDLRDIDAQSNVSSATDGGLIEPVVAQLETRAEEYNRLVTLRNFVHQWRESSVKRERPSEAAQREKAEQSALDMPLGARFTDAPQDFTRSTSRKKVTQQTDATQAFVLAEKEANDREIWAPRTFARMVSTIAKRRIADKDLPVGWQIWASVVPGSGETGGWYKVKLTGDERAPDLAKITVGPHVTEGVTPAPGLLVLQLEPGKWDENLRRAKELIDLLPNESPYLPGLILTMIANPKNANFPPTWVTKLDRLLRGVVMDRCAIIFTSLGSSQAIDDIFFNEVNQLRFDVEGRAPRLTLKDLVQEYLNWWNVEFQYGREQAMIPTVDLVIALVVVSVLMSGLDELLRQILLQCQVSDLEIPFNDFQSRHDIEEACTEMLDYLKALGGSVKRLPITPAAILQEPDILFRILLRICNNLKERIFQHQKILLPRLGLRRPALEKLGREYNEKLERELLPIDRSSQIYGQDRDTEMSPANHNSLKRKRNFNANVNGLTNSNSSLDHNSEDLSGSRETNPKRSRVALEQVTTPDPPLRLSFKVEMAKARLDLRIMQAVDIDSFPNASDRAAARAKTLVGIAEPLIEKVLKSDVPSDKDVVECRAAIELIKTVEATVFDELAQVKSLAISIELLARLSGVGNLEFRELVNSAKGLCQRLSY